MNKKARTLELATVFTRLEDNCRTGGPAAEICWTGSVGFSRVSLVILTTVKFSSSYSSWMNAKNAVRFNRGMQQVPLDLLSTAQCDHPRTAPPATSSLAFIAELEITNDPVLKNVNAIFPTSFSECHQQHTGGYIWASMPRVRNEW